MSPKDYQKQYHQKQKDLGPREVPLFKYMTGLAHSAVQRGRKKKVPIGFTKPKLREYLIRLWEKQKGICFWSGQPMNCILYGGHLDWNATVDRIDPKLGYVPGNLVLAASIINRMKQNFTPKGFVEACRWVLQLHGE